MRTTTAPSLLEVILLGGADIAVSVARCLGPEGIPVVAVGTSRDAVKFSRHCTQFIDLGEDADTQGRWLEWLSRRRSANAVVFPCSDDALELLGRHRAELIELGYRPIEATPDGHLAMLDKMRTYELARDAGVATPRYFTVEQPDDIDRGLEASGVGFPCALKPLHSHKFARYFGAGKKAFVTQNRDELLQAAGKVAALGLKMMVTEIVPGPEGAYCSLHTYLDEHGEPLVLFTKRKLRQNPPGFGEGCYHVTHWDEEVVRAGLQFCQGAGLRGVAVPEFKRDIRDGALKLIECNHRFTYANELVRRAGVNMPLVAYNRLVGRPIPETNGYRQGVRLWNPTADTMAFLAARRTGQLTGRVWLRSLMHRQSLQLLDRDDPRPALADWGRRLVSALKS